MKNGLTELVFILDRSGSMSGLEDDTIGGFNSMIQKQKEGPGAALVTTILFDDFSQTIHDRVPIRSVSPLTRREYYVKGCTALIDAIGQAIDHIAKIHRYARPEDVPERTLFVITTDGMENASHMYTSGQVKKKIEHEKAKYGWEFLFLGANIDAVETARNIGISQDRAVDFHADKIGMRTNFATLSSTVASFRSTGCIAGDWSAGIAQDYTSRSKSRDG